MTERMDRVYLNYKVIGAASSWNGAIQVLTDYAVAQYGDPEAGFEERVKNAARLWRRYGHDEGRPWPIEHTNTVSRRNIGDIGPYHFYSAEEELAPEE